MTFRKWLPIVALLALLPISNDASTPPPPPESRIHVTGEATVDATPNLYIITLQIKTDHKEMSTLVSNHKKQVDAVLTDIRTLITPEDRLYTDTQYINPNYDYTTATRKFLGYTAFTQLRLEFTSLTLYGQLISTLAKRQIESIGDIQYDIKNRSVYQKNALEKAFQNAKYKAEILAAAANQRLGKAIVIQEINDAAPVYRTMMKTTALTESTLSVEPQTLHITARITATFQAK